MNNNINEVITNLYEALVPINYPGVAQIDINNVETTVAKNNRIHMLHWLATQSLSILKPNCDPPTADETAIVQWYSALGICKNREALLGECPLQGQVDTLINLTRFVIDLLNMRAPDSLDTAANDKSKEYSSKNYNIVPPSFVMTVDMKYKDAEGYIKKIQQILKEVESNLNNQLDVKVETDDAKTNTQNNGISEIDNIESVQKLSSVLEEFYEAFQSMEVRKLDDTKDRKNPNFIDNYMETIPRQLSTIKEILNIEKSLSKVTTSEGPNMRDSALTEIIQDIAVELETFKIDEAPNVN